jgi:protein TonB
VDAATLVPVATPVVAQISAPGPNTLVAPTKIPKDIKMVQEDAPPPPTAGVMGMSGMGAGTAGGVFGGISGGGPVVVAAPHPQGPTRISGGVLAGNILSKVQPTYPPLAKVMHLSGVVVLHAIITKDGTIDSLRVSSATNPIFEMAALSAVRQWVYKPYLLNGEPTMVDTTITVNFNLSAPSAVPVQKP